MHHFPACSLDSMYATVTLGTHSSRPEGLSPGSSLFLDTVREAHKLKRFPWSASSLGNTAMLNAVHCEIHWGYEGHATRADKELLALKHAKIRENLT